MSRAGTILACVGGFFAVAVLVAGWLWLLQATGTDMFFEPSVVK